MQSVIFTVSVLIFSSVFLGEGDCATTSSDLSPIALVVERIDKLVPLEKKRKNIVEFLMNPKNLFDLKDVAKRDSPRTKPILSEVFKLFISGPDSCVYKLRGALNHDIVELRNLDLKMADMNSYLSTYISDFKIWDEFDIGECVGHIGNFLEAYNDVEEKGKDFINRHFSEFISIGDFAKPLSKVLLKLLPKEWEKNWGKDSFYGRLNKAIDEDDKKDKGKTADDENKSTEDEKKSGAAASAYLSQIPTFVGLINDLIPLEKKRKNIVDFLIDPKNLTDLVAVAKNNTRGTHDVLDKLHTSFLVPVVYKLEGKSYATGELQNLDLKMGYLKKYLIDHLIVASTDEFDIGECVGHIGNFLEAYNDVEEKGKDFIKLHFSEFIPIGDFAKPLSEALLKLLPEEWEKKWGKDSIYGRLKKAIDEDDKPAGGESKPAGGEIKSTDVENKPADDEKKPTEDEKKPTEDEIKPTEDEKKPTEDEKKPTEDEKKPTEDEKKSAEDEKKSTEGEIKSTEENKSTDEHKPTDENKPADDKIKSIEDEIKPTDVEIKPTDDENKSGADKGEAAAVEIKSGDDENKAAVNKNKTADVESKTAGDENKAAVDRSKAAAGPATPSSYAAVVDKINGLIPVEKRRNNIFEFFKNPKNLSSLEDAAKQNIDWTKDVMLEVSRLLTPRPDGLYSIKNPKDFNNIEGLRDLRKAIATLPRYSVDDFKLQEFVVLIATFLEAYSVVDNNRELMEKYFNNLCFIGDLRSLYLWLC